MYRTLDRYLLREVLTSWLAVSAVLLFILLSNRFAHFLGQAAAGNLPRDAVFALLGFAAINYLIILLPIGLFLAVLLALGRLYKDSEMAALGACGVGPRRIYRSMMSLALLAAVAVGWMALELGPWAQQSAHEMRRTAQRDAQFAPMEPGSFRSVGGNELVFYVEDIAGDGSLRNVFIQRRNGDQIEVATAMRGEQRSAANSDDMMLVLYNGSRYEGIPGTVNFRVMDFGEHGIPIRLPSPDLGSGKRELRSTAQLLRSPDPLDRAEIQWRLSMPIAALVLTFLSVPLSRTDPRQGRYGRLAIGIVVFFLYSNMLAAARVWLERGVVPEFLGIWWVHVLAIIAALLLLHRQHGLFWFIRARRAVPGPRA